ncbi:MAG: hypothetical protein IPJ74_04155 [Saprospiraceae bacterium]|nr:hypothetical protein [Saprospiraceae bacterium]
MNMITERAATLINTGRSALLVIIGVSLGRLLLFSFDNTKMLLFIFKNKDKKKHLLMKKTVFLKSFMTLIFIQNIDCQDFKKLP